MQHVVAEQMEFSEFPWASKWNRSHTTSKFCRWGDIDISSIATGQCDLVGTYLTDGAVVRSASASTRHSELIGDRLQRQQGAYSIPFD